MLYRLKHSGRACKEGSTQETAKSLCHEANTFRTEEQIFTHKQDGFFFVGLSLAKCSETSLCAKIRELYWFAKMQSYNLGATGFRLPRPVYGYPTLVIASKAKEK